MTEIESEQLRAALMRHTPARVRAYRGDDLLREVPVPPGRKRWAAVLAVLARVEWSRLELCDRTGGLLAVVDGQARDGDELRGAAGDASAELTGRDAALLRLLIAGQREVLTNRERETQIAMTAIAGAFKMMTEAIGVLAQVHRMTLDAQAQAFAATASIPEAEGEGEGLESSKMLQQLAPIIMARLLAPPAPAPAATPTNGVKVS